MLGDQLKPEKTSLDKTIISERLVYMTVVKSSDKLHSVPVMPNHKYAIKFDISLCVGLRNVLNEKKKTMINKKRTV